MAKYELKTQRGYDFYEVASALQKSIRRGDLKIAGFFAIELFPQYSDYLWKRLLTISAEDCWGIITQEIEALHTGFKTVNTGRSKANMTGRVFISKAVILLCLVKKNRDADIMSNYVHDKMVGVTDEKIEKYFDEVREEGLIDIPDYAYDIHTRKGKKKGKTREEFFRVEQDALTNKQMSLFDFMKEGGTD